MNPIYTFIQSLPTNGYTTAIGGIASLLYGISGLVTGNMDVQTSFGFIIGGWTALGLGSKIAKAHK
tara:strand:+ start:1172 stop:1369 length:198 start_codon:yes stop_codon:yes gene_type:complete